MSTSSPRDITHAPVQDPAFSTPFAYGGQALMDGVMMRGRDAVGVAIRLPDGRIAVTSEPLAGWIRESRLAKMPFVRGLVVLVDQLATGMRWLFRSSSVTLLNKTGLEIGRGATAFSLILALLVAIGLFVVLPVLLSGGGAPAAVCACEPGVAAADPASSLGATSSRA